MLRTLDAHFLEVEPRPELSGLRRGVLELSYFVAKEARACLFVALFFLSVFTVPRAGLFGIPRYDALLIIAIAIQGWMLWAKLESWDEVKAITLFHLVGFCLELFKTSAGIQSWSYPDFAYTKLFGVPLFAGFMYASVGSYIIQAWRLYDRERTMPLLLAFVLIGFFLWLAENISTFYGIWRYPNQMGAWTAVHWSKWSSWSLLVIMTFTIVANLKHIKARVHVPAP